MKAPQDYAYWIGLAHLPGWPTARVNRLVIRILHNKQMKLQEFFTLQPNEWRHEFQLSTKEIGDLEQVKPKISNYAFLAEEMLSQGFRLIPLNSKEYSPTLKENLKVKFAPPVLYVKGNTELLRNPSVAIVGSRQASDKALQFTDIVARKCVKDHKTVASGFAKGVDRQAYESAVKYNGQSIIVLPQGIMTFSSEIRKHYHHIAEGDVLVLSTFFPKAGWSIGLAMSRNAYIYGLAQEIYVAESDNKGGTWEGVLDGLKRDRLIYVRQADDDEKNANNLLIAKGAVAVDAEGNPVESRTAAVQQTNRTGQSQKIVKSQGENGNKTAALRLSKLW